MAINLRKTLETTLKENEIMEAPEKIYLPIHDSVKIYARKDSDEEIEYARIDAFIDKACEFLKSYRQDTSDGTGYIAGIVNDKTIEDFRKYIEGE